MAAPRAAFKPEYAAKSFIPLDRTLKVRRRSQSNPSCGPHTRVPLAQHGAVIRAKVTEINEDNVRVEGLAEPVRFDFLIIATGFVRAHACRPVPVVGSCVLCSSARPTRSPSSCATKTTRTPRCGSRHTDRRNDVMHRAGHVRRVAQGN